MVGIDTVFKQKDNANTLSLKTTVVAPCSALYVEKNILDLNVLVVAILRKSEPRRHGYEGYGATL